jgi:hypothetical protein
MPNRRVTSAIALTMLAFGACGGGRSRVLVPPQLDLAPYQSVGLVLFTVENAKGSLHELATARFAEEVLGAQRIEVLELGDESPLLRETGQTRYGAAQARAIGEEHGVPAVFFGHLVVSNVKPAASLADLARFRAEVDVSLSVRLMSAESGGTLWSRSSRATAPVGQLTLNGGIPDFGARDPNEAYGELVDVLVRDVTRDMRATWVRR